MTYGEAKEFIALHLLGDNSEAQPTSIHFKMALLEIASRCEPTALTALYDDSVSDMYRRIHSDTSSYIQLPTIPNPITDNETIHIDEALSLAVVYFVASYFSKKQTGKERFESKAQKIIDIYVSNQIDLD